MRRPNCVNSVVVCISCLVAAVAACSDEGAADTKLIATAEDWIRNQLKDPASAQFRNIAVKHPKSEKLPVICGEVNAKNGYGGYVGYSRFVYNPNSGWAGMEKDMSSIHANSLHTNEDFESAKKQLKSEIKTREEIINHCFA